MTMFQPHRASTGDLLNQRFEVLGALGADGTRGYAVRARDRLTGEEVVCKLGFGPADEAQASLLAQYRKLRRIRIPNVVQPLGYFEHAGAIGPVPFLVLEQAKGPTLREWGSGQPLREKLDALQQIASALASLARAGLEHGDLHEDNVIYSNGFLVLIDPAAEAFGSVIAPSSQAPGPAPRDIWSLEALARTLAPLPAERAVIQDLLSSLYRPGDPADLLDTFARGLVGRLANGILPGEAPRTFASLTARWQQDVSERHELYVRLRIERDLAIKSLGTTILEYAQKGGCKVRGPEFAVEGLGPAEVNSDSHPTGSFHERRIEVSSRDGDQWSLNFKSLTGFRKPWPAGMPGLAARIDSKVYVERNEVESQDLELWLPMDADGPVYAQRFAEDLVQRVDARWFERQFAILAGLRIPGVREPVINEDFTDPVVPLRLNAKRAIAEMSSPEGLEKALRAGLTAPSLKPSRVDPERGQASDWPRFWRLGGRQRQQCFSGLVRHLLTERFLGAWKVLYRMDLFELDPSRGAAQVETLVQLRNGKRVATRFEVAVPAA